MHQQNGTDRSAPCIRHFFSLAVLSLLCELALIKNNTLPLNLPAWGRPCSVQSELLLRYSY